MFARHHGEAIKRNGRGVRKRFTEVSSNFFERGGNVSVCKSELVMIGGIFFSNRACIGQLTEVLLLKAHRKSFDGSAGKLRHQCNDDARVNSAAEMRPKWALTEQAHLNCLTQSNAQTFHQLIFRGGPLWLIGVIPVALDARLSFFPNQSVRGR